MKLETQIVYTGDGAPRGSVIWLHGLGANAQDFLPVTQRYNHLVDNQIRFVFPTAPTRPITVNNGLKMPGWFDIYELNMLSLEDETGILESQKSINLLIENEIQIGVLPEKIILVGFSQGGAMALYTALRYPKKLGGIVGLSCYLPLRTSLAKNRALQNVKIPIFMGHGLFDPIVPLHLGEYSKQCLTELDYKVQWHKYPMQHTVSEEELDDVGMFLEKLLIKTV